MRNQPGAWILAGGKSRRMGQDKARLLVGGEPLLVRNARILGAAAVAVHVLAPPDAYGDLGFPSTPDLRPNSGPLAGIETALASGRYEWNLIAACDMPYLEANWLRFLIAQAITQNVDCAVSKHPERGINPLCAVWHRRALPIVQSMLDAGERRVRDAATRLNALELIPPDPKILANWNEPADLLDAETQEK
jgi:molybdenum cofactor guanylyltransferase